MICCRFADGDGPSRAAGTGEVCSRVEERNVAKGVVPTLPANEAPTAPNNPFDPATKAEVELPSTASRMSVDAPPISASCETPTPPEPTKEKGDPAPDVDSPSPPPENPCPEAAAVEERATEDEAVDIRERAR